MVLKEGGSARSHAESGREYDGEERGKEVGSCRATLGVGIVRPRAELCRNWRAPEIVLQLKFTDPQWVLKKLFSCNGFSI